ncbi:hypothetical protein NQ317_015557 [Molorchus minor]|uniref:Attacin C-terminal domain-containing protein n=1 Tax=Molorchus minor TaxID=1323400 RepID=A0ABQ9ITX2_9CUCU|nr:hypothetical protein NQ317_015557 [Molorchus minor]
MKYFALVAALLAVAAAMPFDILEDEDGGQYYAVPVSREKRQQGGASPVATLSVNNRGGNALSDSGYDLGHKGTIWSNNNHQVDGSGYASKNWGSHGIKPDQWGGRVDYTYKPSSTSVFVGADRTPGYGTDASAGLKQNLYQNKNFGVDVTGQYGRHYGGPGGTGKPEAGVLLEAKGTF